MILDTFYSLSKVSAYEKSSSGDVTAVKDRVKPVFGGIAIVYAFAEEGLVIVSEDAVRVNTIRFSCNNEPIVNNLSESAICIVPLLSMDSSGFESVYSLSMPSSRPASKISWLLPVSSSSGMVTELSG